VLGEDSEAIVTDAVGKLRVEASEEGGVVPRALFENHDVRVRVFEEAGHPLKVMVVAVP